MEFLTQYPPVSPPAAPSAPLYYPPSTVSEPPPAPKKSLKSLKWLWWTIGGVVLLGLAGGGYFAYSRGYIAIPFLTPKSDLLFDRLVDSLSEIDNAQYTVRLAVKSEARSAGATSIFPSADEQKAKSRDSERKSDLYQVSASLALYFDDKQNYPETLAALSPTYLKEVPTDPKDQSSYTYQTCDNRLHFILSTGLESDEYYYLTEKGSLATGASVPKCGANSNTSTSWLRLLLPVAHAQATSYSIESIGSSIGLGQAENSYPLLNMLDIFGLGDLESVLDILPQDIDTSAAVTFYTEADKNLKDADALLQIAGSYRGDDLIAEFDVEARKRAATIFGTIRKFPGIPYLSKFVTPLKNKWVKIEPDDGNPILTADTFKQTSIRDGVESVRQSLKDALEGAIVTVDRKLGTETIAGVQSAHYLIALHPDKIKAVLEKVVSDRKAKNQDVTAMESLIKQLDRAETLSSLQKFVDNSRVEVWVDKVKGYLRQISWSVILVPPEGSQKLKDKQFRLTMSLTLDKVNQRVSIDVPGGAIDYSAAERLVTGISEEEQKFNRQDNRIDVVRTALGQLKTLNGSYPSSINNLKADLEQAIEKCKINQDRARNTNTYKYTYCADYLLDSQISIEDIYTGKPYGYQLEGEDYRLTYEMRLNFEPSKSDYSYSSSYKDDYVEGANTAGSADKSREVHTTPPVTNTNRNLNVNANVNINTNLNTNSTVITSTIPIPTAAELPRGTGNYTLVEYADLECPFCSQFALTMRRIMQEYDGQVRWVYRHYPLSFHANAKAAAIGALCVQKLGTTEQYWRYLETLMAEERANNAVSTTAITDAAKDLGFDTAIFSECQLSADTATRLQTMQSGGTGAGVQGTPTTFLVDASGKIIEQISGAMTYASVTSTLKQYVQPSATIKDSDGDYISDDTETYVYRTDPKKKDTDGDSYNDNVEIDNGYNPNGTGKATADQLKLWGSAVVVSNPVSDNPATVFSIESIGSMI